MDRRAIAVAIAVVVVIALFVYFHGGRPAHSSETIGKNPTSTLTIVADFNITVPDFNYTFSLQENASEIFLSAYSNGTMGTIKVFSPQGYQDITVEVGPGNDSSYEDAAFSDPPYVNLTAGTWRLVASLSEVKSVHVVIYAAFL
ncbi:hypothetical protein GCM10007108_09990 [Thermogymnomonas acidicola]|uniref:Uncharacterized protein n=1 Tax=Thermogymnomonas acidicola TaxID=399579 RepID=A0AA37BRC5_9ARCH|nr:hypothetical protein [Thermogymnomonas acidicola]GGM74027.1 hypothetical protein GCM10007108_09990 [Thermogymnomonas acidicola]